MNILTMRKFLLTALMSLVFLCPAFAQEVTFTIVKTDGTSADHVMSSDSKIYYSDTQIFIKSNGETVSYDLSDLRKAYFSISDNDDEIENQHLTIYPNPATDVLKILNTSEYQSVTIYSIDGKVIKRIEVSNEADINVSDLNAGLYIIGVGNEFSKFIKM